MKKNLLLCLVLAFISVGVSAQKFLSFGAKAGVNFSTVTGLDGLVDRGKTDFVGGLFVEVRPLKWLGASVEALYSAEGFVTKDIRFGNGNINLDATYGYIAVPILAKIYVVNGLSVNVGYQPSFAVSSSLKVGNSSNLDIEATPVVSSIPVGLSYSFDFGLVVDARYTIGLTDVDPIETSDDFAWKSRLWSLTIGWRF